jgi:hypothetical protein
VARGVTEEEDWKMSVPFTAEAMSRMETGTFSSTEREVRGALKALQEFTVAFLERIKPGVRVQILGDNQAACSDCERMRGSEKVFSAVKEIHLWAWRHSLQLSFVWAPRTQAEILLADFLSKWEDGTDWRFQRAEFQKRIVSKLPAGWWPPVCDLFASAEALIIPGLPYYSQVWDGSSIGIDACTVVATRGVLRISTSEVGASNSRETILRQIASDTSLPNQTDAVTTSAREEVQNKRSMAISRVGRVIY